MAKKRAQVPSWDEIKSSTVTAKEAELWAETMLNAGRQESDDEYQVVDASGPVMRATSTSNPKRPRTKKAGYDYATKTMTVVFDDGVWWDYYDVGEDVWYEFVMAPSKGAFLWNNGFDSRGPAGQMYEMGPSKVERMPVSRRERLNGTKLPTLDEYLFGRD